MELVAAELPDPEQAGIQELKEDCKLERRRELKRRMLRREMRREWSPYH
jgi:hypothetical protein